MFGIVFNVGGKRQEQILHFSLSRSVHFPAYFTASIACEGWVQIEGAMEFVFEVNAKIHRIDANIQVGVKHIVLICYS